LRCSRSLETDFLERDFVGSYGVPAPLRKIQSVFMVFPLLGKRFPGERLCWYLLCSRTLEKDCWYLRCSSLERDFLERDFVGIYCVPAPLRKIVGIYRVPAPLRKTLLVFTVFPLPGKRFPGERFCRYLRCSRSLEKDFVCIYGVPAPRKEISWRDFVGIYGVPAPLRKILSVFAVFPLPGKRFPGERFCLYLRCSRTLEKDLVGIYCGPAPWKQISWRERFCLYLRCSRSLEKYFGGIYGAAASWKEISWSEILLVFTVFLLP